MRQLIITSRHAVTGAWDTKYNHKAETYLQTYYKTLFVPVITNMMTVVPSSSGPAPKPKQWMFVIQSLSLRPRAFFCLSPTSANSATLSFSILYAQVRLSSLLFAAIDDWPGYIYVTCLCWAKQKQSKENRFSWGKDKGAKSWGQLVHYYHPVLHGLPANGQELILCLGPQPGSLATITCDNRRMSLSFARRPPRRCANRGRLSQFGSKSRWVFWPEMHRCQVWKTLMPSTYSIWVGGSGALFERRGIRLALRGISEQNVHHVISHKKKGFKVICVLLAPSTPGIKMHLWWWNCYRKMIVDRGANTVCTVVAMTLSPPELGSKPTCWSWMRVKEMNAKQMTKILWSEVEKQDRQTKEEGLILW